MVLSPQTAGLSMCRALAIAGGGWANFELDTTKNQLHFWLVLPVTLPPGRTQRTGAVVPVHPIPPAAPTVDPTGTGLGGPGTVSSGHPAKTPRLLPPVTPRNPVNVSSSTMPLGSTTGIRPAGFDPVDHPVSVSSTPSTLPNAAPPTVRWEELRVLVADDEVANRRIYSRMLTKLGVLKANIIEFTDGAEVSTYLASSTPTKVDIMLLDIVMPFKTGVEVCVVCVCVGCVGVCR